MASSTPNFDFHAALQQAERILAAPPAKPGVDRPEHLLSHVVFRAALPAELCLGANRLATGAMQRCPWKLGAIKSELWAELSKQALPWTKYRWAWPICVGADLVRPQVLAVKFSSNSDDAGSNPGKAAIDMLTVRKLLNAKERRYTEHRLGVILDDRRSVVEQLHWWEFQARKWPAFVLVEVRI